VFEAIVGGGVGGFLSAAVAHVVTMLFDSAGKSADWLKGPYGPPFFNISLFMGILYGGIAFSLSRRPSDVLLGAFGPFLGISAPMTVLSRFKDLPWVRTVEVVFVAATWGTMLALGWRLGRGWRGALGAGLGAFAGYRLLLLVGPSPAVFYRLLPSPAVLLDGMFTGIGIGVGAYVLGRKHAGNR
jgi:hypothetical protein